MYEYNARLIRVVDADTLELDIDVGFKMWTKQKVRLLRVDAPERYTKHGKRLTAQVNEWFRQYGAWVILNTEKADSFGRYLAEVTWDYHDAGLGHKYVVNLNDLLLQDEHVNEYKKK